MKLFRKKLNQKEEEKLQRKLNKAVFFKISHLKWISLIAYPFFVLSPFQKVSAQTNKADLIYQQVLQLNFDLSRTRINAIEHESFPNSKIYLNNLNDVLELVFTEDEARFETLKTNEDLRLEALKLLDKNDPYVGFLEAEIKLQWAFVKLKFNKTLSGVWGLRSAYKMVKNNIEAHPHFSLNYKTMGLLHVIFGAVPDGQQWVLSILGLEGDVSLGLKEIDRITNEKSIFAIETQLISAIIHSYLMENNVKALSSLKASNQVQTLAEIYVSSLILMKAHQSKAAINLLQTGLASIKENQQSLPLFYYLLAECQFQGGDYTLAKLNFLSFTRTFKGISQKKDAQMKIALCDYYEGNKSQFEKAWDLAKGIKTSEAEADKNAEKMLSDKTLPNFILLKIRYSIDGGYYSMADKLMHEIDITQLKPYEQFELDYRKARNTHLQGQLSDALEHYIEVINNSQKLPETYFVPNSFLQIGYLQLEQGDTIQAINYFNKVLEFKKHPYKNSLDSKAKIALEAIRP